MTSLMSKENFIDGLKQVIQHPDSEHQLKLKALKLFLFAAVLDGDAERVKFALDNGARADWGLDPCTVTILTNFGWEIPDLPNPESPGVSPECSDQLQSSEEPYPHG